MVQGGSREMRNAAEALEAIEAGAPAVSVELPRNAVINPSREQIAEECRRFGLNPPPMISEAGWRSRIFFMATPPPKKQQFSDIGKEMALAGAAAGEIFNSVPADKLIPVQAFTDELCRLVYGAARAVLARGRTACLASINDELSRSGKYREVARLMDPSGRMSADLWQSWPERVDLSLSACFSPRPIVYCLEELARLHREREAAAIGEQLHNKEISLANAHKALGELLLQANGDSPIYTFRDSEEILSMQFPAGDILLSNGYLAKGDSIVFCGAPSIGKSRLSNQLAIYCALGWPFLGWETNAMDVKWLFLQTENGNKRLQAHLSAMLANLTIPQRQMVKDAISWHTLETEADGIMFLSSEHAVAGVREAVQKRNPGVVVFDPLRDFGVGDLNTDLDMGATLSAISRITREGNPKRIPFINHHALTGKAGMAKAVGFERSGFSRNSKVLTGWTRAQINLAPYQPDTNEVLVVSSGKANNAVEFEAFVIALDTDPGTYHRDDSYDLDEWRERVGADNSKAQKGTIADVVKFVERVGLDGIAKPRLVKLIVDEICFAALTLTG
jgi:hypothetical protein